MDSAADAARVGDAEGAVQLARKAAGIAKTLYDFRFYPDQRPPD
jgi:hypothetical protein